MCSPDGRAPRGGRRSDGIALVELLVGITIGVLVLLAALTATTLALSAAAAGRDASDLQQRADTALRLLGSAVRQAGSVGLEPHRTLAVFSGPYRGWGGLGSAVSGVEGSPGKPDTLRTSFQAESDDRDCLGNSPVGSNRIDNEYVIEAESTDGNRPALKCRGNGAAAKQAVVAGVDDLQLLFGVRNATGELQFVTAAALTASSTVAAVSVCLQLSSIGPHDAPPAVDCAGKPILPARSAGRMVRLARGLFVVRHAGD